MGWRPWCPVGGQPYQVTRNTRHTRQPKLEVVASGLEAMAPSWRPVLPGYKKHKKTQDSQSWGPMLVGRGQRIQVEGPHHKFGGLLANL